MAYTSYYPHAKNTTQLDQTSYPSILKTLADELTPTFTLFFQDSLKQGTIPIDWTTANVVPIFKKGDRLHPINYRPISLTSITCKMLEHIITRIIMHHLDTHHYILHDGFRKRRSIETQLIQPIDNLAHNIDNLYRQTPYPPRFPKNIWQNSSPAPPLQTHLLRHLTTSTSLDTIIRIMNRTQQILLEGNTSSSISVTSRVPQGSVLGPISSF